MSDQQRNRSSNILLDIRGLTTRFYTEDGVVHAVNGISYTMQEGDTLGVVGESGCGKSVHALSIMRLIPSPPGRIEEGEVWFDGRDLLKVSEADMHRVRGAEIAMVFQDPMTSLNPVYTVGFQIMEALKLHQGMDNAQARERSGELLDLGSACGIVDKSGSWYSFDGQRIGQGRENALGYLAEREALAADLEAQVRATLATQRSATPGSRGSNGFAVREGTGGRGVVPPPGSGDGVPAGESPGRAESSESVERPAA